MGPALRVVITPLLHPSPRGQSVLGGTVRLSRFGGDTTALGADETPATLSFHTGFVKRARDTEPRSFELLATLDGTLSLIDERPVFTAPDEAKLSYVVTIPGDTTDQDGAERSPAEGASSDEPAEAQGGQPLLTLRLDYEAASFDVPEALPRELKLPEIPGDAHFLEVGVSLQVGGNEEASVAQNDVLDVSLDAITFFSTVLKSTDGVPLANEPFELKLPDGSIVSGTTNGNGVVQVSPVPRGRCQLRLLFGSDPSFQPATEEANG